MTELATKNTSLISDFFVKIDPSYLRMSAVYLDVIQNILEPKDSKVAYFYLAEKGLLSSENIADGRDLLQELYEATVPASEY